MLFSVVWKRLLNVFMHAVFFVPQVPEMDETYAEDSFVVGSEEEDEESSEGKAEEEVELMPEDSYVDGNRQYATRRRVFLHRARARAGSTTTSTTSTSMQSRAAAKTKRSRVIRMSDSSDEEAEVASEQQDPTKHCAAAVPLWPKVVQQEPSRPQQNEKPSTSSPTVASKVSLQSKTQKHSVAEEKQDQRYYLFLFKSLHK